MNLACPKCAATEVRKLSLIYDEGRSTIRTQTSTSGVGVAGGSVGFGTASSSSVGHQQTALSKQAAPPARKPWMLMAALAGFCGLTVLGNLGSPGLGTLLALGLCVWAVWVARKWRAYNNQVHPGLLENWHKSWMCNRCGEMFVGA